MNLACELGGLSLEHPLFNAAGTCRLPDGDLGAETLLRSAASALVVGSITKSPRKGNSGDVYQTNALCSLNSLGMPNAGMQRYREEVLPRICQMAAKIQKPVIASVAGFTRSEYVELTTQAFDSGVQAVELNFGCPNVWDDGTQEGITSFLPQKMKSILQDLDTLYEDADTDRYPLFVKVSPYSDPFLLQSAAAVLASTLRVRAVSAINTFPNAYAADDHGRIRINPPHGLAGMAGPALKPISLGQVKQWRTALNENRRPDIQIIGIGGISSGQDILDFKRAGADAVAIATALMDNGPRIFEQLLSQYLDLVETPAGAEASVAGIVDRNRGGSGDGNDS